MNGCLQNSCSNHYSSRSVLLKNRFVSILAVPFKIFCMVTLDTRVTSRNFSHFFILKASPFHDIQSRNVTYRWRKGVHTLSPWSSTNRTTVPRFSLMHLIGIQDIIWIYIHRAYQGFSLHNSFIFLSCTDIFPRVSYQSFPLSESNAPSLLTCW